jgi:acyl carrier protein
MTRQGIEDWLVSEIARARGVDPAEFEVSDSFVAHGLDSVTGVALAGDLQKLLGVPLPATLTWDYPSISDLAGHLAEVVAGPQRPQTVKGD